MYIYAPADPGYNIAQNVSASAIQLTLQQMNKAHVSLNQLFFSGQASRNLFTAPHFYSLYQVFIKVTIRGKNDHSLFLQYQGHVESKLRKFTKLLEDSCNKYMNMMVMQLWPYPETFLNPAK